METYTFTVRDNKADHTMTVTCQTLAEAKIRDYYSRQSNKPYKKQVSPIQVNSLNPQPS